MPPQAEAAVVVFDVLVATATAQQPGAALGALLTQVPVLAIARAPLNIGVVVKVV